MVSSLLVVAAGIAVAVWLLRPPAAAVVRAPAPWVTLRHPGYHVSLRHPGDWVVDPGYDELYGGPTRLRGSDGFVGLDAIGGEGEPDSLDAVAVDLANHPLRPYGSTPLVESITVAGQPARLITPSEDQPEASRGEAMVLVAYPKAVSLGGKPYQFFVLYVDVAHLSEVLASLAFDPLP